METNLLIVLTVLSTINFSMLLSIKLGGKKLAKKKSEKKVVAKPIKKKKKAIKVKNVVKATAKVMKAIYKMIVKILSLLGLKKKAKTRAKKKVAVVNPKIAIAASEPVLETPAERRFTETKPKRVRRTRAQIEADEKAKSEGPKVFPDVLESTEEPDFMQ